MSKFPRMLHQWCERLHREAAARRAALHEAAATAEQMRAFVDRARRDIRALYPLPRERCPLDAGVTGTIRKPGYRIEKLRFNSRPHFPVTCNLYVPDRRGPLPCVLFSCGHSQVGKAAENYQIACAGLALRGFLVLIYDPIGQGERRQYEQPRGGCVWEHIWDGEKQELVGDYFGAWRAWDGIRALDYLLERPEADRTRVGITGNSGGGTMTSVLTCLEDRFTMAAPSCFITTYWRNFLNELPTDTEQVPFGILRAGYELYDHLTAAAPRPTLILSKEDDYFDQRGTREAFDWLRHVYALLGRSEEIALFTGKGGHGLDRDLRETLYAFFCRRAGVTDSVGGPAATLCTPQELQVTTAGQVASEGARRVVWFTRERLADACRQRPGFSLDRLKGVLRLPDLPEEPPDYRVLRRCRNRTRIAVETEPDILTVLKTRPVSGALYRIPPGERACLYLPHLDDEADLETEPLAAARPDATVFSVSVRGLGESRPNTCDDGDDFFHRYDADFFYAAQAAMLGFPLAGRRVFDVLRVVHLLHSHGYRQFHLAGRGLGAVLAMYAAPFVTGLAAVDIKNCIPSFADLVNSEVHTWSASMLVRGLLLHFDLPDIVAYLRQRVPVTTQEPWNAVFEPA